MWHHIMLPPTHYTPLLPIHMGVHGSRNQLLQAHGSLLQDLWPHKEAREQDFEAYRGEQGIHETQDRAWGGAHPIRT